MGSGIVICVGNLARGDDGVAHRVAGHLAGVDARVVTAPQLGVELAEDLASATLAVFVDAQRRADPAVVVERVERGSLSPASAHSIDPGALIALCETLYGDAPDAYLVSVAAPEMGHGEGLSAKAEAASVEAASAVRDLLADG